MPALSSLKTNTTSKETGGAAAAMRPGIEPAGGTQPPARTSRPRPEAPVRPGGLRFLQVKHLFLGPALVYMLGVIVFPFLFTIALSFSPWNVHKAGFGKLGLMNYQNLLLDGRFWHSFLTLGIVVAVAFSLEYWIGMGLALLLTDKRKGDQFFRVLFLIPMMVTPAVIAAVWRTMFHESLGPFNDILRRLGFAGIPWLSNNAMALVSVIIVDVWQWTSFLFIMLLAGLLQLPHEPYEAAAIDGASRFQSFRYITMPLLRPVTVGVTLIRLIEMSKIMETIYVITSGGPGTSTETTSYYILIRGFREFRLGYASALSLVYLILMTVALTFLAKTLTRKRHSEEVGT